MTRLMYDALEPKGIPSTVVPSILLAGYVDNTSVPDSFARMCKMFPNNQHVSISSHAVGDAMVLDVERGAVDPSDKATIVGWINRQLSRGGHPIIYANTSTWPQVKAYFKSPPQWWEAHWGAPAVIGAGRIGLQYNGVKGYDISVLKDYIPGIDPVPTPDGGDDLTPQQMYQILTEFFASTPDPAVPHSGQGYTEVRKAIKDELAAEGLTPKK